MHLPAALSPVRIFLLVLGVVFAVEFAIMFVLATFDGTGSGVKLSAFIDAAILVMALCPVLWWLVVRPLRSLVAARGALLAHALQLQEEERARLARDLHDELGQAQTAILLGLRSVSNADTLQQAKERAAALQQMAAEAVDSARRMARGLSPSVLADLGLGAAVERLCEDVASATGLTIVRVIDVGDHRMSHEVEIGAYRVLQEALTNAAKHARARGIRVELRRAAGTLELIVQDDGAGIAPAVKAHTPRGLGMAGMRERIVLLGGSFSVLSRAGAGTRILATIPVASSAEDSQR